MNRQTCLLLLVPFLLAARVVQAGSIDTKERMARMACLSGDFAKGVAILSELFVDTEDPAYIFNQGRCFEQNRRYEDAIARFQEFLRAGKKLSRDDKAEAKKHIADCQDLLAKQPAPATALPPPAPAPVLIAPQPIAPAPVVAPTPPLLQQTTPQIASESGAGLRTAGIVTASVGVAAVVAGVVLNLKVNSMADDMQKTNNYSASKESDRKSYETLGWISYGLGSACIATGAILYVLGSRFTRTTTPVALVPTLGVGQAGAALKGAF